MMATPSQAMAAPTAAGSLCGDGIMRTATGDEGGEGCDDGNDEDTDVPEHLPSRRLRRRRCANDVGEGEPGKLR